MRHLRNESLGGAGIRLAKAGEKPGEQDEEPNTPSS
jgi:hypothetical protein